MRLYGLIGFPLSQSFSKRYFTEKFEKEGIEGCRYEAFEIPSIRHLPELLQKNPGLAGFNVTIPYKQEVMAFLQDLDGEAESIGACNCIRITNGQLKGYNTDAAAFETTLLEQLQPHHTQALILGTGGAARAVRYTLEKLGITYRYVSRTPGENAWSYQELDAAIMEAYPLIINTTPLGSFPKTEGKPDLPYALITSRHYLYDLVYNPPLTAFLSEGKDRGALIKNGYDMLVAQAELSWNIWNS
ncbi:shikimate dehydrogenase family protein [Niabella drilacis]|uniref:Shikimate dehydrogenase n=1 Tax=Niabella drilacis (strain DSM 25811 / CCM 8410 / CCUG 62505 / LMG 26954 / E90) TaxID=1285928 RepID=A0A1G7A193_NIADE|nr:shikimate dehydrogenase [Niabella drilacis]SDE07815.1 shikimate dehydrogenase [Niabella drilacis]